MRLFPLRYGTLSYTAMSSQASFPLSLKYVKVRERVNVFSVCEAVRQTETIAKHIDRSLDGIISTRSKLCCLRLYTYESIVFKVIGYSFTPGGTDLMV